MLVRMGNGKGAVVIVAKPEDVEYAVDDCSGQERIFKDPKEAQAFAISVAIARGEANLDVLVWSAAGALAYGGSDAVEAYREDPEASVFERFAFMR